MLSTNTSTVTDQSKASIPPELIADPLPSTLPAAGPMRITASLESHWPGGSSVYASFLNTFYPEELRYQANGLLDLGEASALHAKLAPEDLARLGCRLSGSFATLINDHLRRSKSAYQEVFEIREVLSYWMYCGAVLSESSAAPSLPAAYLITKGIDSSFNRGLRAPRDRVKSEIEHNLRCLGTCLAAARLPMFQNSPGAPAHDAAPLSREQWERAGLRLTSDFISAFLKWSRRRGLRLELDPADPKLKVADVFEYLAYSRSWLIAACGRYTSRPRDIAGAMELHAADVYFSQAPRTNFSGAKRKFGCAAIIDEVQRHLEAAAALMGKRVWHPPSSADIGTASAVPEAAAPVQPVKCDPAVTAAYKNSAGCCLTQEALERLGFRIGPSFAASFCRWLSLYGLDPMVDARGQPVCSEELLELYFAHCHAQVRAYFGKGHVRLPYSLADAQALHFSKAHRGERARRDEILDETSFNLNRVRDIERGSALLAAVSPCEQKLTESDFAELGIHVSANFGGIFSAWLAACGKPAENTAFATGYPVSALQAYFRYSTATIGAEDTNSLRAFGLSARFLQSELETHERRRYTQEALLAEARRNLEGVTEYLRRNVGPGREHPARRDPEISAALSYHPQPRLSAERLRELGLSLGGNFIRPLGLWLERYGHKLPAEGVPLRLLPPYFNYCLETLKSKAVPHRLLPISELACNDIHYSQSAATDLCKPSRVLQEVARNLGRAQELLRGAETFRDAEAEQPLPEWTQEELEGAGFRFSGEFRKRFSAWCALGRNGASEPEEANDRLDLRLLRAYFEHCAYLLGNEKTARVSKAFLASRLIACSADTPAASYHSLSSPLQEVYDHLWLLERIIRGEIHKQDISDEDPAACRLAAKRALKDPTAARVTLSELAGKGLRLGPSFGAGLSAWLGRNELAGEIGQETEAFSVSLLCLYFEYCERWALRRRSMGFQIVGAQALEAHCVSYSREDAGGCDFSKVAKEAAFNASRIKMFAAGIDAVNEAQLKGLQPTLELSSLAEFGFRLSGQFLSRFTGWLEYCNFHLLAQNVRRQQELPLSLLRAYFSFQQSLAADALGPVSSRWMASRFAHYSGESPERRLYSSASIAKEAERHLSLCEQIRTQPLFSAKGVAAKDDPVILEAHSDPHQRCFTPWELSESGFMLGGAFAGTFQTWLSSYGLALPREAAEVRYPVKLLAAYFHHCLDQCRRLSGLKHRAVGKRILEMMQVSCSARGKAARIAVREVRDEAAHNLVIAQQTILGRALIEGALSAKPEMRVSLGSLTQRGYRFASPFNTRVARWARRCGFPQLIPSGSCETFSAPLLHAYFSCLAQTLSGNLPHFLNAGRLGAFCVHFSRESPGRSRYSTLLVLAEAERYRNGLQNLLEGGSGRVAGASIGRGRNWGYAEQDRSSSRKTFFPPLIDGDSRSTSEVWRAFHEGRSEADAAILRARHKSICMGIVFSLGRRLPYSVDPDELVSPALFGLHQAIYSYRPDKRASFKTYAAQRVRGAVLDYLRDCAPAGRPSMNIMKEADLARDAYFGEHGVDPDDQQLLDSINAARRQRNIRRSMEGKSCIEMVNPEMLDRARREAAAVLQVSSMIAESADGQEFNLLDVAVEPRYEARGDSLRDFDHLMTGLSRTERKLLTLYYREDFTMKEVGEVLDLSESRVSQLHAEILERLRKRGRDQFHHARPPASQSRL